MLPTPGMNWPPTEWAPIWADYQRWEAWWTGDTTKLHEAHQVHKRTNPRRGLAGFMDRYFWGRANNEPGNRPSRADLHVPIATDLCATSAELLYSQTPTLRTLSDTTNARLDTYVENGLLQVLQAGAESGAAFGGRYHRVTWDPTITDQPFLSTVDADQALPTFRWGKLVAVTFWTVVHRENTRVLRHVERHELDQQGYGHVYHGLYDGTVDNLGRLIPLTEHESTAPLATVVDENQEITTAITPGLLVAYVPNALPQRRWRNHPTGHALGRSDLDGIEPLMDALDETYSSWMRDIRLGKARVFIDRAMLEDRSTPAGMVSTFDLDREIFTPLEGFGSANDPAPITAQQFQIRVAEHQETARDLTKRIIRAARYSPATFGDDTAQAVTATEIRAREQATITTRNRKIVHETVAIKHLLGKMLTVDQLVYNTPGLTLDDITVEFPPLTKDSTLEVAQTTATLKAADLMSTQTALHLLHPDWDTTQVDEEATRIHSTAPVSDPATWTHPENK